MIALRSKASGRKANQLGEGTCMIRLTVGGLALLLMCACSHEPAADSPPSRPPVSVVGTLASDSDCFYVDEPGGTRHVLVFTPRTVTVKGDALVYGGTTFRPGDDIELFGGTTAGTSGRGPIVSVDISACDPDAEAWIVR